jgi:hypothetical protein
MADPCYFGDYPASMRKALGSALPTFTPEQSAMLKGTLDYFAVRLGASPGAPCSPTQSQAGQSCLAREEWCLTTKGNVAPCFSRQYAAQLTPANPMPSASPSSGPPHHPMLQVNFYW